MTTTVRLNFAKPPGLLGLFNVGNTQTMKASMQGDNALVINVDPSKHLNADGSFKKLDTLINDPALSEKERTAFAALKSADHVELLGHGAAGGDAIYSNPAQNFPTNPSTSWYGETAYQAEHIGAFLADCDKGPNINVISCHGASTENGQSICTRLRASLNKKAMAQGKPTGAIQGYTRSCGIAPDGDVFLSVNSRDERACSKPWWTRIPIIGFILSFLANLWDALTGNGGPRRGTSEYNELKAQAERDSVLIDDLCLSVRQSRPIQAAEVAPNHSSLEKNEPSAKAPEPKPPLNAEMIQKLKGDQAVEASTANDTQAFRSKIQGLQAQVVPSEPKEALDRDNASELRL